jgi:large subunit ribosomal protein L22
MEAVAKLRDYPTSPRKMRLLADEIRGMSVEKALALLEHHPQHSSRPLHKLLWSAVKNWEQKNEGQSAADNPLVVKTIFVDGARVLKRMRPAPQGRGYRVRKRSNHITIAVDELQGGNKIKGEKVQDTSNKAQEGKEEGTSNKKGQGGAGRAKRGAKKEEQKSTNE